MKKLVLMLLVGLAFYSCKKIEMTTDLHKVVIQLNYPQSGSFSVIEGVKVVLKGNGSVYEGLTDANGRATLNIPSDIYDISSSDARKSGTSIYNYNGLVTNKVVVKSWVDGDLINIDLQESKSSQLVLKEIFVGGTPKDNASGAFTFDSYIIIYNNSDFDCTTTNLTIGAAAPLITTSNSQPFYGTDGKLNYENAGYIPTGSGIWYFPGTLTIKPGEQVVVALYNAVDNTTVHTKSINFANPNYYAMYDIASAYKNASYYVSPSALIPTSHYLKAIPLGGGNAWTPSVQSPGFIIFEPNGETPAQFMSNPNNVVQTSYRKIPTDWILDGVEIFVLNNNNNKKRFTAAVDAGSVPFVNGKGYTVYRNVDEAATLALPSNAGKIVYGYDLGSLSIDGNTDPSNINAEASIRNGARIIYKDSNNSTNDLHLRLKASLSNY